MSPLVPLRCSAFLTLHVLLPFLAHCVLLSAAVPPSPCMCCFPLAHRRSSAAIPPLPMHVLPTCHELNPSPTISLRPLVRCSPSLRACAAPPSPTITLASARPLLSLRLPCIHYLCCPLLSPHPLQQLPNDGWSFSWGDLSRFRGSHAIFQEQSQEAPQEDLDEEPGGP